MRTIVTVSLFALISMLPACSPTRPGVAVNAPPEIREITLTSGHDVAYTTGNGESTSVTFRSDGTAETRVESTQKFAARPAVVKRARFSTDQFERLARVIEENGFFEKKEEESHIDDVWQNLKVVTATGEKTIHCFGRSDPQIKAMLDAIDKLADEVKWETAP